MNELTPFDEQLREITKFEPAKSRERLAKLDALTDYAKKIRNWPLLEEAVDAKIQEQTEFCAWWQKEVTPNKSSGKYVQGRKHTQDEIDTWRCTVFQWRKCLKTKTRYRARLLGAEYRAALLEGKTNYEDHENENDEYLTPEIYIEAARKVLGEIDLDPATRQDGQQIISAKTFFTKAENGLTKKWQGRVWLNPPYSDPLLSQFIEKLIESFSSGDVAAAILLTNASTDTAWWHGAERVARSICFTRGRVRFIDAMKGEITPTRGQSFFYFGQDGDKFTEIFKAFGAIR